MLSATFNAKSGSRGKPRDAGGPRTAPTHARAAFDERLLFGVTYTPRHQRYTAANHGTITKTVRDYLQSA